MVLENQHCNYCGCSLQNEIIDLGHQPPSNSFLSSAQILEPEVTYPLKVYKCYQCGLVQLPEFKKANEIFNDDYVYFSSDSPSNVSHAKKYVDMIVRKLNLTKDSSVLEIGSNDGYMLQFFQSRGIKTLGIDPSLRCASKAGKKGIKTLPIFFNAETVDSIKEKFDLICGINVMNHQSNINSFVHGLKKVLAKNGTITIEFPCLRCMLIDNEFDTIYHEHYSYFSLTVVKKIFDFYDLDIYNVEHLESHGGSLRIYACHKNSDILRSNSVKSQLLIEDSIDYLFDELAENVLGIRMDVNDFLFNCNKQKQLVVAYGAAAKANTFFNYCKIDNKLIKYIVDRAASKQYKYCPGSHIMVMEENRIKIDKPDYVLITAWNLKDEIMEQLSYIREWGGKFVVAIPSVEIYD